MRKDHYQDVWLGLFVVAALAVLTTGALWIAGSSLFGAPLSDYRVLLQNSAGLQAGDRVRLAGVPVGKIQSVRLLQDGPWPVEMQISLNPEVVLREDATATIASASLLGTSFLELDPGSPETAPLPKGASVRARNAPGIEAAFSRADELTMRLTELIDQSSEVLEELSADFTSLTSRGARTLSDDNLEHFDALIATLRDQLDTGAPRLTALLENLERFSVRLDEGTAQLPEMGARVDRVLLALDRAMGPDGARLDRLLDLTEGGLSVATESLGVLGENREEIEIALDDLAETSANLRSLSQRLKERPYSLVRIRSAPDRRPGDGVPEAPR